MSVFTKNTYNRSIDTLRKKMGKTGTEFLADTKAVIDFIDGSDYSLNSKKVFYISLVSVLKNDNLFPDAMTTHLAIYKAKMDELNRIVSDSLLEQKLSASEQKKYMEWPAILDVVENKIFPATQDLWSYQEYLIACLYTMMPPVRLDYAGMSVVSEEPAVLNGNYLVWNASPYFVFAEYKTYKRYGAHRVPVPASLKPILTEWFQMVEPEWLLLDTNGQPMPEWLLGQTIIKMFEKHAGKSVGVSVIRHSYVSYMRKDETPILHKPELAKQLLHSPQMSQLYRRLPE
jgi:hypothetical protein